MDYQDFTIGVCSAAGGGFEARVLEAPLGGNPQIPFLHPIEREALEALLRAFDRPGKKKLEAEPPPGVSPREVGEKLYSTLFRNGLEDLYSRCCEDIPDDSRKGLRLRLKFRLDDPEAEYLASLPWEWLWNPQAAFYIATDRCTPVVRDLGVRRRKGKLKIDGPLRILVVDAAPSTMKQLHLKLEIERMTEALGPLMESGQVELLQLETATPEALRDGLLGAERKEPIHVLHFMGHGGYHTGSGNGAVFFVKENGEEDQVDGEELGDFLKGIPSLRLVVLNACKTARHKGKMGEPLNYGVASALLGRTGIPAVVANQYSISDLAAIAFSKAFYGRIAEGDSVDAAITEVRLKLKKRSSEWATPVLFLTGKDGKLFKTKPAPGRRHIRVVKHSRPEDHPVRLGVRTIVGWGRDMEKRNDAFLDLGELFEDRYIKNKASWQERIFPDLRAFLLENVVEGRPLLLDFAAHSSIAFAAGWVLEPKSGLDVRVRQRTGGEGEFEWHPKDGTEPEGVALWLKKRDIVLDAQAPDVALALAVSHPDVAKEVREFIRHEGLPVGRIINAVIAPAAGQTSVRGGAHALRLAQALLPRLRQRRPHEREGRLHIFCASPNALVFYLGQLASSLESLVLYEYPFKAKGAYSRYQKSIELPPPGEAPQIPANW